LRYVDDLFAGNYRSIFKGKGLEFEDVREYQLGDDIRRIDWNVSARSQEKLFTKNFREERELTVLLIVDISASSRFSHTEQFKSELIAEVAALLAFSAIKNHDKVGLILFSNEIELYLQPKKGVRHVLRVIRELLYFVPKHTGTDVQKALRFASQVQKKKGICFIFSDFLVTDFYKEASLIAKKHECFAFHVYDALEKNFSAKALFSLTDLETDEHIFVDTAESSVQTHFQEITTEHAKNVKHSCRKSGMDYCEMNTKESPVEIIRKFFLRRNRKNE
jgi:uncharacterized protein (DUF58 family)